MVIPWYLFETVDKTQWQIFVIMQWNAPKSETVKAGTVASQYSALGVLSWHRFFQASRATQLGPPASLLRARWCHPLSWASGSQAVPAAGGQPAAASPSRQAPSQQTNWPPRGRQQAANPPRSAARALNPSFNLLAGACTHSWDHSAAQSNVKRDGRRCV